MADDAVVVFIASRNTSTAQRRVLWRMSREDARRLCSDARTSNDRHMLCWTADDDPRYNRLVEDNGRYAQVLADLGIELLHPVLPTS